MVKIEINGITQHLYYMNNSEKSPDSSSIYRKLKDISIDRPAFAERAPLITILFAWNLLDCLNTVRVFGPLVAPECTVFVTSFEASAVEFFRTFGAQKREVDDQMETFTVTMVDSDGEETTVIKKRRRRKSVVVVPSSYCRLSDAEDQFRPLLGDEAADKYLHPSLSRLSNFLFDVEELKADVEKRVPERWQDRDLPKNQKLRKTFQRAVYKVQDRLRELNPKFSDIVRMSVSRGKRCPDLGPGAELFQKFIPKDEVAACAKQEKRVARAAQGGRVSGREDDVEKLLIQRTCPVRTNLSYTLKETSSRTIRPTTFLRFIFRQLLE